jgi:hypothetical protein
MRLQPFKFILLTSLGLLCFQGNSRVLAGSEDIMVPTTSTGTSTTIPPSPSPATATVDSKARFSCQFYDGKSTVMYQPQSQPGKYFAWAAPTALGGGWDPEKRCQAIASRLESYRPDGLQELRTAIENNQNIVCVTTQSNSSCRIVLTVPPGKDPVDVRNGVFHNLTTADTGDSTIAVDTYTNNSGVKISDLYKLGSSILGGKTNPVDRLSSGIDLKPFLDPQDGGTGKQLHNGVAIHHQTKDKGSLRLNPQQFR